MNAMQWLLVVALTVAGPGGAAGEAAQLGKPGRVEATEKGDAKPERPPAVKTAKPEPAKVVDGKVNINAATRAQLMSLDGVGSAAARRIIAHREANGPFKKPEDLAKVDGVGKAVLERNAGRITVR